MHNAQFTIAQTDRSRSVLVALSRTGRGGAAAHHGDADRYNQDVVTVTGTVVEVQMVNPHARIILDVEEGGKTVRWQAELGGPQQLIKQFGWTPATIKKGMKLTMIGRRLKSGAPYLNLTERANIVVADTGKEIYRTDELRRAGARRAQRHAGAVMRTPDRRGRRRLARRGWLRCGLSAQSGPPALRRSRRRPI